MTGVSDNEKDRKAVFFAMPEFIKRTAKHTKDAKGFYESKLYLSAFLWLFSLNIQAFSLIFSFNRSISKELIL